MRRDRALVIMSKAPVPGQVKTRLIPALGGAGAAKLHRRLLERTLHTAGTLARDTLIELHVSPHPGHPALSGLLRDLRTTAWPGSRRSPLPGSGSHPGDADRGRERESRHDPNPHTPPSARPQTGQGRVGRRGLIGRRSPAVGHGQSGGGHPRQGGALGPLSARPARSAVPRTGRSTPRGRLAEGPAAPRYGSGLVLRPQFGADLGERMCRALSGALEGASRAVLIGTDCPGLSAALLEEALEALNHRDAVLGPALDGGYVLIGLRIAAPTLFQGIPWGTDQVLEMSRVRLRALGWCWHELEPLRDLDRPNDLLYFPELTDYRGTDTPWDGSTEYPMVP